MNKYVVKPELKMLIVEDEEQDFRLTRNLLRCVPIAIGPTVGWRFKYKEAIKLFQKKTTTFI